MAVYTLGNDVGDGVVLHRQTDMNRGQFRRIMSIYGCPGSMYMPVTRTSMTITVAVGAPMQYHMLSKADVLDWCGI